MKAIKIILFMTLMFFAFSIGVAFQGHKAQETKVLEYTHAPNYENELQKLVENYRENIEHPITKDDFTCDLAEQRSKEIVADWSHNGFRERAKNPDVFYPSKKYIASGENLARNFKTAQEVMNGWINSPTHFEILNKETYNHGCVKCAGNYCALIFGANTDEDSKTPKDTKEDKNDGKSTKKEEIQANRVEVDKKESENKLNELLKANKGGAK